jgi:hypothetical protein
VGLGHLCSFNEYLLFEISPPAALETQSSFSYFFSVKGRKEINPSLPGGFNIIAAGQKNKKSLRSLRSPCRGVACPSEDGSAVNLKT